MSFVYGKSKININNLIIVTPAYFRDITKFYMFSIFDKMFLSHFEKNIYKSNAHTQSRLDLFFSNV